MTRVLVKKDSDIFHILERLATTLLLNFCEMRKIVSSHAISEKLCNMGVLHNIY